MNWAERALAGALRRVDAARSRSAWLDHLVQAGARYQRDAGDRLAASITYYAFLSFFPLMLLALSLLAFLVDRDPALRAQLLETLNSNLPGVYEGITDSVNAAVESRRSIGVIGILGLLWAGLGWLDALRESLRVMWHHDIGMGNIAKKKAVDVVTLLLLGATLVLSLLVTGGLSASASWVLGRIGLYGHSNVAIIATTLLGFLIGVITDTALFGFFFTRLPRIGEPFRRIARGALFAAVGFGLLKFAGRYYVANFMQRGGRAFGVFAVVAGLLIWMNLVARFTLYAAAWTVTAAYADDVLPSGTSSPAAAVAAGLTEAQSEAIQQDGVSADSLLSKQPLIRGNDS